VQARLEYGVKHGCANVSAAITAHVNRALAKIHGPSHPVRSWMTVAPMEILSLLDSYADAVTPIATF